MSLPHLGFSASFATLHSTSYSIYRHTKHSTDSVVFHLRCCCCCHSLPRDVRVVFKFCCRTFAQCPHRDKMENHVNWNLFVDTKNRRGLLTRSSYRISCSWHMDHASRVALTIDGINLINCVGAKRMCIEDGNNVENDLC